MVFIALRLFFSWAINTEPLHKVNNTIHPMIPIEENTLFILFRRGKTEYIKNLFEEGEIYMNTVDFIRDCDNNQDRSDPYDSIQERQFLGDVKIKMCDVGQDINKDGVSLNGKDGVLIIDSNDKGNIYCLSGIYTKDLLDKTEITEFKTKSFGESLIVISSPGIFIQRIKTALFEAGYKDIIFKPVDYYPNEYSGHVGPFKKHQNFSHQREFRLYVPNSDNKPIKINIGSIKDIAIMKESCCLRFEFTDNRIKTFMLV